MLALKLLLTPLLVGGSALVARRWGPAIGGWLIALPLTSGPVLAFLVVDHGVPFASLAAVGSLTGLAAIACFSLAYARAARRDIPAGPWSSLAAAAIAFFASGGLLVGVLGSAPLPVAVAVLVSIVVAGRTIRRSGVVHRPIPYPRWDIPARMAIATILVVGLTSVAPLLGAGPSGLVATYPVYVSVLTAFTHHHAGPVAATDVLAGLIAGLYGTAGFYLVVIALLVPAGPVTAFVGAIATALAIQAVALRRTLRAGVEPEPA